MPYNDDEIVGRCLDDVSYGVQMHFSYKPTNFQSFLNFYLFPLQSIPDRNKSRPLIGVIIRLDLLLVGAIFRQGDRLFASPALLFSSPALLSARLIG
jgi:hypothetical protein